MILKSFSQVFFQENIVFGALIATGLLIASPLSFFLAVLGSVTGYIVHHIIGLPKELIKSGIFGFNGLLIGIAISVYIKSVPLAVVLTIAFTILGTVIYLIFYRTNVPPLTGPFVLTVWIFLIALKYMK